MDVSNLTPRQRANVAGLQLKKDAIRRKYGNAVQILTTDEEAANASGWMALPLNLLTGNKQLTLRMDKQVVDTINSRKLSETYRDEMDRGSYVDDVVVALEEAAYGKKAASPNRQITSIRPERTASMPAATSMSDTDFIKNLIGK